MIKSLVGAVALMIGLAGCAGPSPDLQPGPSPDALNPSIFWSPAGGNPIHYAQTSGFYAGGR